MTRIYRYGCRTPDENLTLTEQQLLLAGRYRNKLVEIERVRRAAVRDCLNGHGNTETLAGIVRGLEERVEVEWITLKAMRRSGLAVVEQRARAGALKAELKEARARLRAAKSLLREDAATQAQIGDINDCAAAQVRAARAASGLYWGTYLVCEQAIDAARKRPEEPRFRRYDGTGRIAVELIHGLSVTGALGGTDTRLRLQRQSDMPGRTPGSRRADKRWRVWLRIGSTERREPVWTSAIVTLHRPLPPDGTIKWAWLQRDRTGPDYSWSLHVTVEEPDAHATASPKPGGTVAIDLGWRSRPDGVRAGYWQDGAGNHNELLLPAAIRDKLDHARSIGAIRGRNANGCQARLVSWIAEHQDILPEWFRLHASALAQWKSADRLAALAWRWKQQRFAGDDEVFNGLVDPWRVQDRHLHRWSAYEADRVLGWRNEQYRIWASRFSRWWGRIVIEQFDLRGVVGRASLDDGANEAERVKADRSSAQRHIVAPSMLRLALINAAKRYGAEVISVPAEWTTIDCSRCGKRLPWDPAPEIEHRCAACGELWDQDEGACRNLLTRAASGPVTPIVGGALAKPKSARQQRFARRRDRKPKEMQGVNDRRSQNGAEDAGITEDIGEAGTVDARLFGD